MVNQILFEMTQGLLTRGTIGRARVDSAFTVTPRSWFGGKTTRGTFGITGEVAVSIRNCVRK